MARKQSGDRIFMSHCGRAIWYRKDGDGNILYMVAKGDGTDEYFTDWHDAFEYCEQLPRRRKHN